MIIIHDIAIVVILAFVLSSASEAATVPSPEVDEETCIDLCSSCDGVAEFDEDGHCECSIAASNGTECLSRMKRQAREYGLDLVSYDSDTSGRSIRCALTDRHRYGESDIELVAKYFMQDGPMTGSIFIAPPYTQQVTVPVTSGGQAIATIPAAQADSPIVGRSADCDSNTVGAQSAADEALPEENDVVGAEPITQPKELMPTSDPIPSSSPDVGSAPPAMPPYATGETPLDILSAQNVAPQFLAFLGDMLSRPILGLPQTIQSVSQSPGVSDLVGAPANFFNSLADRMAERSRTAKENLENYREVVGRSREKLRQMVGQANERAKANCDNLKNVNEAARASKSNPAVGAPMRASKANSIVGNPLKTNPSQSIMNPSPAISYLNPNFGAANSVQLVGAGNPMQLFGAGNPMQLVGAAPAQMQFLPAQIQLMQAPLMRAAQLVSASPTVGSASPSSGNQIIGAGSPMVSAIPVMQSFGTIPLSSIVSQMPPTYLVGSPMAYIPAVQSQQQPTDETAVGEEAPNAKSLEEVPLSDPPQKKICKKSTKVGSSMKFTRDVKVLQDDKEQPEVKFEQTTTTTTELPMIYRTTTQKPKNKSVIGKIKSISRKTKAEKKISEHKS